jgi:hypothetical protein
MMRIICLQYAEHTNASRVANGVQQRSCRQVVALREVAMGRDASFLVLHLTPALTILPVGMSLQRTAATLLLAMLGNKLE